MGHGFAGCLRELCNTTFCIIKEGGCCPFLKGLEGNKKSLINILFINFCIIRLLFVLIYIFIIPQKNLERLYERINRIMILFREVFKLILVKFKK
jgi:hypothetical protein